MLSLKMKLLPKPAIAIAVAAARVSAFSATTMPPLSMADHLPIARKAMDFLDRSPDPFHCVQTSVERLLSDGFVELRDDKPYTGNIKPGGKYFFTKNKSSLVAFAVGEKYQPGNGFKVIGGHSDSPNLKVKPRSKRSSSVQGYHQIGVECYGGGLWHTWFDRDLGISGRILVREDDGTVSQKLVKIDRPILRIPNLAIHLQTQKERCVRTLLLHVL
jgi:aspartyl aminopeptidase